MKTLTRSIPALLAALAAVAATACSGTPERAPTGTSAAALTSGPVTAASLTGTWDFALDDSEVASKVHAECEGKSGGDSAKSAACYAEIKAEGATEKLRFTPQADGKTLWTSFGQHGDKEELFLQAPLQMSAEGPTRLVGKLAGELSGKQAEEVKKAAPLDHGIAFELEGDRTLVMPDPHKGKLVFHKE